MKTTKLFFVEVSCVKMIQVKFLLSLSPYLGPRENFGQLLRAWKGLIDPVYYRNHGSLKPKINYPCNSSSRNVKSYVFDFPKQVLFKDAF